MNYIQKSLNQSTKAHRTRTRSFLIFMFLVLISYFLFLAPALAQQGIGQLGLEYGTATGLGTSDIRVTVARIIQVFLGLLGIVAVALVVYGGYLWMTSAGNEEKVTQAKELLTNAGIGLAIILLSFAIVQFVVSRLIAATTGVGLGGGGGGGGVTSISQLSNSLGSGIIREHYPSRDALEIPRNVKVIVTFKDPISIPSMIKNYDDKGTPEDLSDDVVEKNSNGTPDSADDYFESLASAIQIYPSEGGRDDALAENQVRVDFTPDLKIWVLDPQPLLGSPSEKLFYSVELGGGAEGIRKTNGDLAFSGVYSDGYTWEFQVSTFVDNTPPKVESAIPLRERECATSDSDRCARNVIITINFNEAIDPTTVSGVTPGFTNVSVLANNGSTSTVAGTFTIVNQYRSVEFTPALRCGAELQPINLVPNPSFEEWSSTLPTSWTKGQNAMVTQVPGRSGSNGARFSATSVGNTGLNRLTVEAGLNPSTQYAISYYVKRVSGTGNLFISIDNTAGNIVHFAGTSGEWVRVSEVITTSPTTLTAINFWPTVAGDEFDIDDVQVEQRGSVTPFVGGSPSQGTGVNSCGEAVFCLPGNSNITVTARAATLGVEPPSAAFPYPFDGVTDAVGNSLSGDRDDVAEGPPVDNYVWIFGTSDIIDLTPPSIISTNPLPNAQNVNADSTLTLEFSELMRLSTLTNETVILKGANAEFEFDPAVIPWYGLWNQALYWPSHASALDGSPQDSGEPLVTQTEIRHGTFMVNTSYYPEVTSGVQDLYQNCLFPPNRGDAAPEILKCNTTTDKPYCCFGPAGFTEEVASGIQTPSGIIRGIACSSQCVLSPSGNAVCQE